jgi:uncharacterized protein YdhG (YjbR/CyaY superfamily)
MKKQIAQARRAPARRAAPKTVEEYFERVPDAARDMLTRLRAIIQSVVPPDAVETISYGIPAFKRGGVLVWYAAFADHCSLFPTGAAIEAFEAELRGFKTSKGTIQFALDERLPTALLKKIDKARVAQAEAKNGGSASDTGCTTAVEAASRR